MSQDDPFGNDAWLFRDEPGKAKPQVRGRADLTFAVIGMVLAVIGLGAFWAIAG